MPADYRTDELWIMVVRAETTDSRVYSSLKEETFEIEPGTFEAVVAVPFSAIDDLGEVEGFIREYFEYLYIPIPDEGGEGEWDRITVINQDVMPLLEPRD